MEEQFISFQTAKLAKEKGFNIESKFRYASNGRLTKKVYDFDEWCEAPTQSILQKWLREKHRIHIHFCTTTEGEWQHAIIELKTHVGFLGMGTMRDEPTFNSYEEALESGLYQALKLI